MNKTRKSSFTALLCVLVCALALVLSLGIFCACDSGKTMNADENASTANSGPAWYYGDKAPAEDLGEEGDYYLNTETLASYVKEGKTWREAVNGETGASWYYGTSAPNANLGSLNDFYLNTSTGELYQKGADSWGTPLLTLKGTAGRDGVVWHSGKGNPNELEESLKPQDALAGDFYLDYSNFDVYQLKENGTWGEPLGSIKGDKGDAAKDPIQFYDGKGAPKDNEALLKGAKSGDLYLGVFYGWEEGVTGAGSRLYRYNGTDWDVLMDTVKENQPEIHSYEQLIAFATSVANGNDYAGKEVHLKTKIDFNEVEAASLHRAVATIAAGDWTPIGTEEHPFKGTFDGEGNTISNFSEEKSGFFGYVQNATVKNLHFVNVKAGSLVGTVVEGSTVTVEQVRVDVDDSVEHEVGRESSALVGSGDVTFAGENEVSYPVADGVNGFVENHHMSGEEVTISYEISSVDGLTYFAKTVNEGKKYIGKTVELAAEIDLTDKLWTPIGGNFCGTFDGNGQKIIGLNITGTGNLGFFGTLGEFSVGLKEGTAIVTDLVFENVTINGAETNNVGALVGYARANLSKITVKGDVSITGKERVGGIAGGQYGNVSDVHVESEGGSVVGFDQVGGLIGYLADSGFTLENSSSSIDVSADVDVGGAVGTLYHGNVADNVTVSGKVTLLKGFVESGDVRTDAHATLGGIVGSIAGGAVTVKNSSFTGQLVYANTSFYRWKSENFNGQYAGELINVYNDGYVGADYRSEYSVAYTYESDISYLRNLNSLENNRIHAEIVSQNAEIKDDAERGGFYLVEDENGTHYEIDSADGMKKFSDMVNFSKFKLVGQNSEHYGYSILQNRTVYLKEDIDLDNDLAYLRMPAWTATEGKYSYPAQEHTPWLPIGCGASEFRGSFDGMGHTVSNLYIRPVNTYNGLGSYAALFGSVWVEKGYEGKFENLTIKNVDIDVTGLTVQNSGSPLLGGSNGSYVASLIAISGGNGPTVASNIKVLGEIDILGKTWVGGLFGTDKGENQRVRVEHCTVDGTVAKGDTVRDGASVISATNSKAGGLIGGAKGINVVGLDILTDNMVKGLTVKGPGFVGGLVGQGINYGSIVTGNTIEDVTLEQTESSSGSIATTFGALCAQIYTSTTNTIDISKNTATVTMKLLEGNTIMDVFENNYAITKIYNYGGSWDQVQFTNNTITTTLYIGDVKQGA